MKKLLTAMLTIALSVVTALSLTACGKKDDVSYVKKQGKLVIGVTDYAPYDYQDENGKWIGFDADMARLVGEELGVETEFVEISWDAKITELKSKKIDLIWNGMTVTDELKAEMDFSYSYAKNSQVAVIKKSNAQKYTNLESIKGAKVVAEGGSAGETAAVENFGKDNVTDIESQVKALMEVMTGTADVAIIDYSMAASLCGKGSYSDLQMVDGVSIGAEEFAVGIRKGSNLVETVNKVLVNAFKSGKAEEFRQKYGANADGSNSIALCDLSNK